MNIANTNVLFAAPTSEMLWEGGYKIPWDDPEFSRRMLAEHLSQDHDLASRRARAITEQVNWLHMNIQGGREGRILDLGCGPGLYAADFAALSYDYLGVDFGPASIEHARNNNAFPNRCRFRLGNVLRADLEDGHDLVLMLYGELNVFPPGDAQRLLRRAWEALAPGGRLVIEVQTRDAVRALGEGRSWYAADRGLFSEAPHVCLIEGHYFADEDVALQLFHVLAHGEDAPRTYRSTTKAWSDEEYRTMLEAVGFGAVAPHADWPGGEALSLYSAQKPNSRF